VRKITVELCPPHGPGRALGYPDVRIVLSMSWVRVYKGVARVARKLTPELRARVIGATYHGSMDAESFREAPRGMQIWADVLRRQPDDWLAVDDGYLHWPTWCRDKRDTHARSTRHKRAGGAGRGATKTRQRCT
jgi:hypothetical protein